jgi:lipopolysaccharide export system permease protein
MKKIDKLVLTSFIGPFILTFFVVVFILLNIQMLKYFDDIIGKGLEGIVIARLLFYFAVFTTPTALPLAVLLSSLITFGNLGEHFELTAIKGSGISLLRTLQPIFFFVLMLTVVAFYINNNLVPKAALEAYSLLYDIKQKKPALELREGAFYMGIPDVSIKINKKFRKDDAALKGVVIYDHRKNEGNNEVTVADSGRMYTILHERYLKLELYNGYHYSEGAGTDQELAGQRGKRKATESLSRSKFSKSQLVFDLSSFKMQTTDKKWFQGNRIMRNLSELQTDVDSMDREVAGQKISYYNGKPSYFTYYRRGEPVVLPQDVIDAKKLNDSLTALKAEKEMQAHVSNAPVVKEPEAPQKNDSVQKPIEPKQIPVPHTIKPANAKPGKIITHTSVPNGRDKGQMTNNKGRNRKAKVPEDTKKIGVAYKYKGPKITDSLINARIDSIYTMANDNDALQRATNTARQVKGQISNANSNIDNYTKEIYVYDIQWHKIIASSMACIAMFLIGAPLGSIIKKGGLGVPFLVSILFFIIFYVLNMIGEKWAKQGMVDVFTGVWASDFILLIIGLIFLRQARIDARLFDTDFYLVLLDKFKRWRKEKGFLTRKMKVA